MEIKTKFNIDERRWFINRKTLKAEDAPILELRVVVATTFDSLSPKYSTSVFYTLNGEKFSEEEIERKTFATKEELLASL